MLTGILVFLVIVTLLLTFFLWRLAVSSRNMDVSLGHDNGQLTPCPASLNCVSSQVPETDSHFIMPIADPGQERWPALEALLDSMEGATRQARADNYLYYTFRSPLMGFVDDVELLNAPEEGVIHVRSASRVGRRDLKANMKRIEAIRASL